MNLIPRYFPSYSSWYWIANLWLFVHKFNISVLCNQANIIRKNCINMIFHFKDDIDASLLLIKETQTAQHYTVLCLFLCLSSSNCPFFAYLFIFSSSSLIFFKLVTFSYFLVEAWWYFQHSCMFILCSPPFHSSLFFKALTESPWNARVKPSGSKCSFTPVVKNATLNMFTKYTVENNNRTCYFHEVEHTEKCPKTLLS